MTLVFTILTCLSCFLSGFWCLPLDKNDSESDETNFIGKGTNELAVALLQGYANREENLAYSPFGFSVLLAVFSEGAKGTSREEIESVLHFPHNIEVVREKYKNVLERFSEKTSESPEFKNWFYVFKNFTINEDLQEVLRNCYLTEVKYVDGPIDHISNAEKSSAISVDPVNQYGDTDESKMSPIKYTTHEKDDRMKPSKGSDQNFAVQDSVKLEKPSPQNTEKLPEKNIDTKEIMKSTLKNPEEKRGTLTNASGNMEKTPSQTGNISKEVENESKDLSEKTSDVMTKVLESSTKDLAKEQEKATATEMDEANKVPDELLVSKSKSELDKSNEVTTSSEPKVQLTDKIATKEETDSSFESVKSAGDKNLFENPKLKELKKLKKNKENSPIKVKAAMGALPIEHLSGMTDSSIKTKKKGEPQPQIIVFNGMYYKGEWQIPFVKRNADPSRAFYKSDQEKVYVPTIHSEGYYNTSTIEDLNCQAIDLPYKGGRYSLLVLVPNDQDGLNKLISKLSGYPLSKIHDQLSEKLVEVCMPTFEINTISKPVSSLKEKSLINVTRIFDPDHADLSKISGPEPGLFVDELVQMVTFKIDSDHTKANYLTASIAYSRSEVPTFRVNRPFLFFLRDKSDDMTVVNGKIVDPTPRPAFYFS